MMEGIIGQPGHGGKIRRSWRPLAVDRDQIEIGVKGVPHGGRGGVDNLFFRPGQMGQHRHGAFAKAGLDQIAGDFGRRRAVGGQDQQAIAGQDVGA